jgi:succinate dehydrogenase/fumarate reductase flavoprotein subunit
MGLGDYLSPKDTFVRAIAESIPKLEAVRDESIEKMRQATQQTVDETIPRLRSALDETTDHTIARVQAGAGEALEKLKEASHRFVGELEVKWEERLKKETKEQLRLLNRVLLYTLLMALISFGYALAKRHLGL